MRNCLDKLSNEEVCHRKSVPCPDEKRLRPGPEPSLRLQCGPSQREPRAFPDDGLLDHGMQQSQIEGKGCRRRTVITNKVAYRQFLTTHETHETQDLLALSDDNACEI